MFPLRTDAATKSVRSFLAEGRGDPPEVPELECASIAETAAEKFVAVTRRAGAEPAGLRDKRDPTLVRHLYDLHVIREHYDEAAVATLAKEIMPDEVQRSKGSPAVRSTGQPTRTFAATWSMARMYPISMWRSGPSRLWRSI